MNATNPAELHPLCRFLRFHQASSYLVSLKDKKLGFSNKGKQKALACGVWVHLESVHVQKAVGEARIVCRLKLVERKKPEK